MKKVYEKPTAIFMELRPEEKLALCDWPTTQMASVPGCASKTYANISEIFAYCQMLYNQAQAAHS